MSDAVTDHYASENAALLRAWGNPDSATARARFDRIVDYAKTKHHYTESEARNCSDHRLVLAMEEAMLKDQAEEQVRKIYRGEVALPPPAPTVRDYLNAAGEDMRKQADIVSQLMDTSEHDARQAQIDALARRQGIQGW